MLGELWFSSDLGFKSQIGWKTVHFSPPTQFTTIYCLNILPYGQMSSKTHAKTGLEETTEKAGVTVVSFSISLICQKVLLIFTPFKKNKRMDYTVLFYFQSRLKCQSYLCTFYFFALIFNNIHFRRLFSVCYHFKGGIGEDMALVHLLKELYETPSALLILRAIIMQGKRQHVLVLPERTSITVARKSPSNTNLELEHRLQDSYKLY